MTTDNRTNEPTEAQAELARRALNEHRALAHARCACGWPGVGKVTTSIGLGRHQAWEALMAAQGAAPQVESADCDRDRMGICKRCGMGWDARKVLDGDFACPVLPSSGVDEDALAEELESCLEAGSFDNGDTSEPIWFTDDVKALAAHLAEWLKGQGGESRGER